MKFTNFTVFIFLMLLSPISYSWDSITVVKLKRVIADEVSGMLMLETDPAQLNSTGCTNNNRPKWSPDSVFSSHIMSLALTAAATGSDVRILTSGCIGNGAFPRLGRIELFVD